MNLVVGATGMLGGDVCRRMVTEDLEVAGLVRRCSRKNKIDELSQLGINGVIGDLREPDSLDAACRGVKCVIATASAMPFSYDLQNTLSSVDQGGMLSLISAAKKNKVKHFIYVSATSYLNGKAHRADIACPLILAKRIVEEELKESGIRHTILRASHFSDVWLSPAVGFDTQRKKVLVYGTGENAISWISVRDLASVIAALAKNAVGDSMTIEIGGPEALTPKQVVKIFEEIAGSSFALEYVSENALRSQKSADGHPMSQSFSALMLGYAGGDPIEMPSAVRELGVEFETMHEYASRTMTGLRAEAAGS